jgi:hypothetical protein
VWKLTLDTSCVIHAVQKQGHAAAVENLVGAARTGRLALFLTAAFTADLSRASAANRGANLAWLAEQPILRGVPGPFRLDYSRLDGRDVLIADEQAVVITRIENIVLPHRYQVGRVNDADPDFAAKRNRKMHDVQHLAAHYMAGHDAFVTSDEDDILKKRGRLRRETAIVALSLDEAVAAFREEGDAD